ncbi:MAG: SpoIID/LytB domain-containing protein, partial [Myxococcota bacterium]
PMALAVRGLVGMLALTAGLTACDEAPEPPADVELRRISLTDDVNPAAIPVPEDAACSIRVRNHGTRQMESDYLPNVIACEAPGNATLEMLEAQAIAARSYAYYFAETSGEICNGQGCQVFSCGRTPTSLHRQAVENTSGVVMRYNDNLTIGFYVAGDPTPNSNCVGNSAGVSNTERWVTYNEGRSGTDIEQTRLGFRHSTSATDYGQNRGALSQWGAQCLSENFGYGTLDILRYYYGEDVEFVQVEGDCVTDVEIDLDEMPATCTPIDPNGDTILDNGGDCMRLLGPSQFWRTEDAGINGSLRWTKSTRTTEHNVAVWKLNPTVAGEYRIQVHVDPEFTSGTDAQYELISADASQTVDVDQTVGGWIDLGVVRLDPEATDQQVRMTDAIGVSGQILQADALRVRPATAADCEAGDCPFDDIGEDEPLSAGGSREAAGCSVQGNGSGTLLGGFLSLLLFGVSRRRARCR